MLRQDRADDRHHIFLGIHYRLFRRLCSRFIRWSSLDISGGCQRRDDAFRRCSRGRYHSGEFVSIFRPFGFLANEQSTHAQVRFHPLSPNHLFIASRRSTVLQVYDLRNPSMPFSHLPRNGSTNQRLSFDIDPWGRYLVTGDQAS
jgi:hypothetical protein